MIGDSEGKNEKESKRVKRMADLEILLKIQER